MKLNLIFIIIILILLFLLKITNLTLKHEQSKATFYQQNQKQLQTEFQRIKNDKLKLEEINRELKILSEKDSFNWHQDISNTNVIKRLQKD